jgi:hypothetical protein
VDRAGFAADKNWFSLNRELLSGELAAGSDVRIDFGRASYTTQSAIHALLYEPLRRAGPTSIKRLWFAGASRQVRAVLNLVVSYALDPTNRPR